MDNNIKMYTREEVGELFHIHVNTVSMLRETGILTGIKLGKNYMFPQYILISFQKDYIGLDCSNREKAMESKMIVEQRHQQLEVAH